jgi:glycosyltransferase involved in cell wall biosynthesis
MTAAPMVSVVMPVYNAEVFLRPAIESILDQTFKDFECLIVDDASTDSSPRIIQEYAQRDPRIRVWRNMENLRISRSLNRGIEQARGRYIARMDGDDVAVPGRLEKQVAYMEAHPEVGISGGTMKIMDGMGRIFSQRHYHLTDAEIRRHLFRYSPFSHPLVILRKAVLDQVGYYDPAFDFAEDYELYFRIGRVAQFGNLPDVLLHYRMLPNAITARRMQVMETKTLAIRQKAVREYGYTMTWRDRLYGLVQRSSRYLMPDFLRIWLFTALRGMKKPAGEVDPSK